MLDELNRLQYKIENLQKQKQNLENNIVLFQNQLNTLNEDWELILESQSFYKKAIDVIYERSVQQLKDVLNTGLRTVFPDRELVIDVVINNKRGKSLNLIITDEGEPVNLRCAMGMGVKCVVSAILHIYYLQCKNSKILMLDETYSGIWDGYIPAFFEFLSQLCKKLQFKIIMITHDKRFLPYADKAYIINLGEVSEN